MSQEILNKKLCIYHGNCADGFAAAWVVWKKLGPENVDFHAGVYGKLPPDVTDRDVIIVDFSYKHDVMIEIGMRARSLTVLDHHKSAAEDLKNIVLELSSHNVVTCVFDMERSGARIAWDHFFPGQTPPPLLAHVEDRDLWRFAIPKTREVQADLFSYPYDFEIWDKLMVKSEFIEGIEEMALAGAAIERKHHKDIAELTQVVTRRMIIGGYNVPVANLPYTLTSDAGHLLCGDAGEFAACYWDTDTGRVFSLRSRENGVDVAKIAEAYGGGGHAHAAGFRISFKGAQNLEVPSE